MIQGRLVPPLLLALLLSPPSLGNDAAPADAPGQNPAAIISDEIFGPRVPTDLAFGAFQRGYFLTALEFALPRAGQGDATAQTLIAEIYAKGLGVVQNDQRAAGWYQLASNNGDMLATFELALLYQDGTGVPKNRARAADLFAKAADAGYIPAKYNMALLHIEGIYASPSLTTAAALMLEAATAELPEAQYDYGTMLVEGAGVAPNPAEGARYIALAAAQNLIDAQVDYATMLYMGQGVDKDVTAAANWYARAAEAGNAVAQNRYAKLLAVGEGVPLNLEDAAMWRALSRRQGLNDPSLDRLLVSIPPADLARAEERARFWPSTVPSVQTILEIPTIVPPIGDKPADAAPTNADAPGTPLPTHLQNP
ncbi:MAG: tetratricopeptide repeat protein [Devosia sp.]